MYSYLGRVMYNRRTKFDPLWTELVIAGFDNGTPYVGLLTPLPFGVLSGRIGAARRIWGLLAPLS